MGEPAPCSLCWRRPRPGTLGRSCREHHDDGEHTEETAKEEKSRRKWGGEGKGREEKSRKEVSHQGRKPEANSSARQKIQSLSAQRGNYPCPSWGSALAEQKDVEE